MAVQDCIEPKKKVQCSFMMMKVDMCCITQYVLVVKYGISFEKPVCSMSSTVRTLYVVIKTSQMTSCVEGPAAAAQRNIMTVTTKFDINRW